MIAAYEPGINLCGALRRHPLHWPYGAARNVEALGTGSCSRPRVMVALKVTVAEPGVEPRTTSAYATPNRSVLQVAGGRAFAGASFYQAGHALQRYAWLGLTENETAVGHGDAKLIEHPCELTGPLSVPRAPSPPSLTMLTFAGTPSPTRNRNGITATAADTAAEPCCNEIEPEYSLAGGIAPVRLTVSLLEAPAARTMLDWSRVT